MHRGMQTSLTHTLLSTAFVAHSSDIPPSHAPLMFLIDNLTSFQKPVTWPHVHKTQPSGTSTPAQFFPFSLMGPENPILRPLSQKHPKELMNRHTTGMMLMNKTLSVEGMLQTQIQVQIKETQNLWMQGADIGI